MKNFLIVIANSHQAKIFSRINETKLHPLVELEAELDSNHEKPGVSFSRVGTLRHSIEPHTDRRKVERHQFAEKIAEALEEFDKTKSYNGLILLASHQVLSEIEKSLSHNLQQKLVKKMAKDLLEIEDKELEKYL